MSVNQTPPSSPFFEKYLKNKHLKALFLLHTNEQDHLRKDWYRKQLIFFSPP